jgi:hypothetical protein
MWIALRDTNVIHIDEGNVHLSQFLKDLQTPVYQSIEGCLSRSDYKKVSSLLVEHLAFPSKDKIDEFYTNQIVAALTVCRERATKDQTDILQRLLDDYADICKPVAHALPFIPDRILTTVCTFMAIPHPAKSDTMFNIVPDTLRTLYRTNPSFQLLRSLLPADLHPYLTFIEELSDSDVVEMARAACLLVIPTLTVLTGCRISMLIPLLTEEQFRQRYQIPCMYRHSVHEYTEGLYKRFTGTQLT